MIWAGKSCVIAQCFFKRPGLSSYHRFEGNSVQSQKLIDVDQDESPFINPIERSLLSDLIGLYTCDLKRERHLPGHARCLACAKEDILRTISNYIALDAASNQADDTQRRRRGI